MKPQRIEISYKTIVFTTIFLLGLAFFWSIRELIILFFICFILMGALNPIVVKLETLKVPRPVAILFLYLIILSIVIFCVASVVPILIEQSTGLIRTIPLLAQNFNLLGLSVIDISSQLKVLETIPTEITKAVIGVFSNILSGFVVLVVTFYLLLDRQNFPSYIGHIFGSKSKKKAVQILSVLETRLSGWVVGQIILMTIIGLLSYIGYLILGLNYSVPLALIAGLLEIVPNIGPVISTLMAAAVGLSISPTTALLTLLFGLFIQQLENNFVVPKIMKETVGLSPLITIFTIAVGAKIAGVGGAILAVPTYLTIETIVTSLWPKEQPQRS